MSVEAGRQLLHYRLIDKIGEGGMGVVWRAVDTSLDRQVAIKVLPESVASDAERLARFAREAKLLGSLQHPNIAVVHGLHRVQDTHFIAMELVAGEDLATRLIRGPLPVAESIEVATQIAEALAAAHASGVVHRDLKPANVRITPDGQVKVLDFGLAKAMDRTGTEAPVDPLQSPTLTSAGSAVGVILGTPAYMSPEQTRGQPVDGRTDVWAFGCVLYEMLTGTQAFAGPTGSDTIAAILTGEADWDRLPAQARPGLERVVRRCLQKDTRQRTRDLGDVALDLREVEGNGPGDGSSAVVAEARPRWRSWKLAAVAAGALLVALAIAAGIYMRLAPASPSGPPLTTIAVLPFADMSPDGDQEWLANGMAEELIESVSRIQELRVIARTSAFALRGQDIKSVGAQLGAGSVVEGSVRRSGDELRITAQLIRASDGSRVWSARYDRALDDVFSIQTEIARQIAEAIRGELGIGGDPLYGSLPLGRYVPRDVRAYELMRKGIEVGTFTLTNEALRQGSEYYRRALEIDPEYADARAMLGLHDCLLWMLGFDPSDERRASAEAAAARALEGNPTNATAHQVLAMLSIQAGSFDAAEELLDRALEVHPQNGGLRMRYAEVLAETGRLEAAMRQARRAVDLDPLAPARHFELGNIQILAGEYDAAIEAFEYALELSPRYPGGGAYLSSAYHLSGRDGEALEVAVGDLPEQAKALEAPMRQGFEQGGYEGMVRALNQQLVAFTGRPCGLDPGLGAHFYAITGDPDPMYGCLEKALASGRTTGLYLGVHPVWEPYRSDARFQVLLRRRGLETTEPAGEEESRG